jgi:hypothetical protein
MRTTPTKAPPSIEEIKDLCDDITNPPRPMPINHGMVQRAFASPAARALRIALTTLEDIQTCDDIQYAIDRADFALAAIAREFQ